MAGDFVNLTSVAMRPDTEAELLRTQTECTIMWPTRDGHPIGVIMSYVWSEGSFWLTSAENRARVKAWRRDPRVAVALTSTGSALAPGKGITYKGIVVLHDDEARKQWYYKALADIRYGDDPEYHAQYIKSLDTPGRVIIEVKPEVSLASYDGALLHGEGRGGNPYAERGYLAIKEMVKEQQGG